MAPKIVNKREKREKIIHCAVDLFAEKGFADTTVKEIADAAHIGKGTIYEYFDSKEEILMSAFRYYVSRGVKTISAELRDATEPEEIITAFLRGMAKHFHSVSQQAAISLFVFQVESILSRSKIFEKYGDEILKIKSNLGAKFIKELSNAIVCAQKDGKFKKIDHNTIAMIIYSYISGISLFAIFDKSIDIQETNNVFMDIFFNGITTF
mgnify:CR=1 FL=1